MTEKCPSCKEILKQIGNQSYTHGDSVTCGMCGHSWKIDRTPIAQAEADVETELKHIEEYL